MYILEVNHGGGEIHRHFLLPGQTYTLGRKECRILLPAAEPSISRHHATIVVAPMPRYSVLDPSAQLEVRIEDVSKHGTFVDRERVGKDNTRFLYPEDRIRLGLRVTARIIPMVLILGISPDLTDKSLDAVLDSAVHMGALVVEDAIPPPLQYYERHTNCVGFLYIAEEAFAMEETMMQALGYGYTLVTPDYVMRLVRSLEEKDTLMPSEFPAPSSPSPASMGLRAVHYRRPAQTFFSVTEFLSAGKPIVANVFHDYTFLIVDDVIRESYAAVVAMFGGVVEVLSVEAVAPWCDRAPRTGNCPLTTVALVAEDDFRLISEAVMERGGGRGSFATEHTRPTIASYLALYKCGVCLIPEENVHLSLYRNDGKELNIKSNACYLQRTSEDVLADGTPTTTPVAAEPDTAAAAAAAQPSPQREPSSPPRKENSTPRTVEPVIKSPPAPPAITHAPPVNARRSREPSYLSALSSSPRGESADRNASTATASPANPPVIAKSSSPRASSPPRTAAAAAVAAQAHSSGSATPSCATSTSVSATTASAAPAPATAAAADAAAACHGAPPTLDADKLGSHTIAPSYANAARSNSSSTAPPDGTSAITSTTATPTAVVKPTASATGEGKTTEPANTTSATAAAPAASASTPLTDEYASAPRESPETSVSVGRCRIVGRRASHPFSLGLRARQSDTNHSDDDDGDAQENGSPVNGSARRASITTEATSEEVDEGAAAAAAATASTQSRRPTSSSVTRRSSVSGRRASVGAQPSPVILPLKSEEVVRPRSRAASGSQQTAYAAAVAALGRRSGGAHSEERPPLAPPEDGQHLVTVEEAQRRSSGSMEHGGSQGMPPLPPPSPSTTTAPQLHRTQAKPNSASASSAETAAATAASTATTATTVTTPVAAAAPAPEKVLSAGPSSHAAANAHASVRRGEQRLASASVPTPRRSLVRVNPVLAAIQHERSASPQHQQSTHTKLKRFTTPERDVVVHGATQVGKSPPRQRVEAVRINASERRASASRDPEASLPRHADAEDDAPAGSMGNRRSVLRRESVSAVNRPPPLSGGPITRRASSSFHRSDSAQLRDMATPHRLTTSRISSSVPRTRRSKAYGSVQRQRSPEPSTEETSGVFMDSEAAGSGVLAHPGPLAQRASIRRRRSSPTQPASGSSNSAAANTRAVGGGGGPAGSAAAVPGQIPGLRGSSAAPVLGGTSNATAETYFRINDELNTHCQKFMKEFIDDFMSDTERVTRSVVRQTYMDAPSKETLEAGVERILEFLQYVNSTEPDIPSMYSTSSTRAACHQVRQKSQYALSKIKACYKTVNCKVPSSLTRARAALSTRNVSPTQRRLASVAGVNESSSAAARRQSTF